MTDKPNIEALYNKLLMEVQNKYPNETRHETARRYLRERETTVDCGAKEAER